MPLHRKSVENHKTDIGPVIISVVCPEPSPSENESVVISTNGSVSVASFACDIGFSISGPQQLECRANGLWDNIQPICGKKEQKHSVFKKTWQQKNSAIKSNNWSTYRKLFDRTRHNIKRSIFGRSVLPS